MTSASDSAEAPGTGASQRRLRLLQRVMDLFLSESDKLTEHQVTVFDEILLLLMQQIGVKTLAELGASIAGSSNSPRQVVRQLAFHQDGEVAAAILSRSNQLAEHDLCEIAGSRGQKHLLAISARRRIAEKLSDVLATRGGSEVALALAANDGAKISERGYRTLAARAAGNDALAARLAKRSDIPAATLAAVLTKASEAVQVELLNTAPARTRDRIQQVMKGIKPKAAPPHTQAAKLAEVESRIQALSRAGKLTDSTVSRFALDRAYLEITAALSLRSRASRETIEALLNSMNHMGLVIACRASDLDWSTATALIRSRPNGVPPSKRELEEARSVFGLLATSAAQNTLQIWSAQDSTARGDAPLLPNWSTNESARAGKATAERRN